MTLPEPGTIQQEPEDELREWYRDWKFLGMTVALIALFEEFLFYFIPWAMHTMEPMFKGLGW